MNQHDHLTLLSETQDRNAINLLETRQVMFLFILELNKKVTTPFFSASFRRHSMWPICQRNDLLMRIPEIGRILTKVVSSFIRMNYVKYNLIPDVYGGWIK